MLVSGAVAGVLLGLLVGRNPRRVEQIQIVWLPLLMVALAMRAIAPRVGDGALAMDLFAIGATGVVALRNLALPGVILIATGCLLNLVVISLNSGMPVDGAGLSAVGAEVPNDGLHHVIDSTTRLQLLGDVVVVGLVRSAYSVGDFLIATGAFLVSFLTLSRR